MEGQTFNFVVFLLWLAGGAGGGTVSYLVLKYFKWDAWWPTAHAEMKRAVSILVSIVVACLAWLLLVAGAQIPVPIGWWNWLLGLTSVAGTTYIVASGIHGVIDLRARDMQEAADKARAEELVKINQL